LAGSESKDEDMADYIRAADAIREIFDCAVVIVHHCGIDGTRPRGHTSLTGAADAQHAISRDAANNIITIVEWMKDDPEGDTIVSRLKPVDLGCDEDGEPISSCVVVPVEGGLAREARKKPTKMPKAAQIALRALAEAVDEQGQTPPASAHIPAGVRAVSVPVWREQCYRRGICTTEGDRAKRQAFKRASEHLIGSSSIGIWDDLAWLAR
jgi:hypothetical protein